MIKTKNDAVTLANELKNSIGNGHHTFYPAIYFYNKDQKRFNYIIKTNDKIISLSFEPENSKETEIINEVEQLENFIWNNRKYLNKSSDGIKLYDLINFNQKIK